MKFNAHSDLEGFHAVLSPSKYHWLNYDDEKFDRVFRTNLESIRGTELHDLANKMIRMRVRLPDTEKTLDRFVNDAIGYRMRAEQLLVYTRNAFGTADAIQFRDGLLRIHDLKTGVTPTSMKQLHVYAALFCLEYGHLPAQIDIELRIYQNDEIRVEIPDLDDIMHAMDRLVIFDRRIEELRAEMAG